MSNADKKEQAPVPEVPATDMPSAKKRETTRKYDALMDKAKANAAKNLTVPASFGDVAGKLAAIEAKHTDAVNVAWDEATGPVDYDEKLKQLEKSRDKAIAKAQGTVDADAATFIRTVLMPAEAAYLVAYAALKSAYPGRTSPASILFGERGD